MSFIDDIKTRAKSELKTIVLPEASDIRVLKATEIVFKEGFAHIILLGNEDKIKSLANENGLDISKAQIINPAISNKSQEYAQKLFELRKHKGLSLEEAQKLVLDPVYFGVMMVKLNEADGLVSGAIHSTSDTLRPALQILKTAPNTKLVSTFVAIETPDTEYGENGILLLADCALNPNPNEEELADIAAETAKSFKQIVGKEPKIAMLSYSTHGSAKSEMIDKVANATKILNENFPELVADGELQLDSAIVPSVAQLKAPNSKIRGDANILIFPDLNSGNIGYKLVQRFGNANAYGPVCQGIAKPVNDLSRGCSAEDIAGVIAITAVQANKLYVQD